MANQIEKIVTMRQIPGSYGLYVEELETSCLHHISISWWLDFLNRQSRTCGLTIPVGPRILKPDFEIPNPSTPTLKPLT